MSLADDQKFINIKFHYLEEKTRVADSYVSRFTFIHNKEDFEKYKNNPNIKVLNTGWKVITWSDHNNIYSQCLKYETSPEGVESSNLDFIKYRDMKLKACLKQWDYGDDDSGIIDTTIINQLHPDVANELLNGFERVTESSDDELKSLEMVAEAFFEGKKSTATPPPIVYEFFVCKHLYCSFQYVRQLPMLDFVRLLKLCIVWESVQRKWEAELATAGMSKKSMI